MDRPAGGIVIRWLLPVLGAIGVAAAISAVRSSDQRVTTYAQSSAGLTALTLAAGLGLVAVGAFAVWDRTGGAVGQLAIAAGLGWLAPLWTGWTTGPELAQSLGLVVAPLMLPALVHLVLVYSSGRATARWSRVTVVAVWLTAAGLTVARAAVRDPFLDPNCWSNCTTNAFLVDPHPELAYDIDRASLWFALTAGALTIGVTCRRLARGGAAIRLVVLPAAIATVGYAASAAALLRDPLEDPAKAVFRSTYLVQAVALVGLAIGLGWAILQIHHRRSAVARLADDLGAVPPPGALQTALARTLGDTSLRVFYWLPGSQQYVDAAGRPVALPFAGDRATTPVVRHGQPIALVEHDPSGYNAADLGEQIGSAARLAIDNERLAAEVQVRMEDLRSSRTRIVEAADAARRHLERDLHDGAQQRLLAFTYQLRLARTATTDPAQAAALDLVLADAQTALAELRELANGIFPAILEEAGLESALWSLADQTTFPIEITAVPPERLAAAVERVTYLVVAGAVESATGGLSVAVSHPGRRLVVEVRGPFGPLPQHLADRVGALAGTLEQQTEGLRVEMPCEPEDSIRRERHANRHS